MDTNSQKRVTMSEVLYGNEPSFTGPFTEENFIVLNRYYEQAVRKEKFLKTYLLDYMQTHAEKYSSLDIDAISAVSVKKYVYQHRPAILARAANRGAVLSPQQISSIENEISSHINTGKDILANPSHGSDEPSGVQKHLHEFVNERLTDFEVGVDECVLACKIVDTFNPAELLKKLEFNAQHARILKDHFKIQLDDLSLGDADETYGGAVKANLLRKIYTTIISACDAHAQENKPVRKPRKINPTKMVKRLKFLAKDDTLHLSSIGPVGIVGATELWVFNTKNRQLIVLRANDADGLRIKGSTILNFDEKTSFGKTMRHPEEKLKDFIALPRLKSNKAFEEIRAVGKNQTGRINKHCLLLKVFTF